MINIQTLDTLSEDVTVKTFLDAFADYATSFSAEQVKSLLKFRGFDPRLSFGAFDGERPAAFVFNGIGNYLGVRSAYDSGTGTLPQYRGQGLVKELLKYGDTFLKAHGIRQYVLEVLCSNAPAIHIYEGDGFVVTRELICFGQTASSVSVPRKLADGYEIKQVGRDILPYVERWVDYRPSWQNDVMSMERGGEDVTYFAAVTDGKPVGMAAVNARQGDLMMLAVDKEHRGCGIGSRLLAETVGCAATETVKILNVDASCQTMLRLLESCNIPETVRQYEMVKSLG